MQCDPQAIELCRPLVPDERDDAAAALTADAENRGRTIECQQRQAAAAACLHALERAGVVTGVTIPEKRP